MRTKYNLPIYDTLSFRELRLVPGMFVWFLKNAFFKWWVAQKVLKNWSWAQCYKHVAVLWTCFVKISESKSYQCIFYNYWLLTTLRLKKVTPPLLQWIIQNSASREQDTVCRWYLCYIPFLILSVNSGKRKYL